MLKSLPGSQSEYQQERETNQPQNVSTTNDQKCKLEGTVTEDTTEEIPKELKICE